MKRELENDGYRDIVHFQLILIGAVFFFFFPVVFTVFAGNADDTHIKKTIFPL